MGRNQGGDTLQYIRSAPAEEVRWMVVANYTLPHNLCTVTSWPWIGYWMVIKSLLISIQWPHTLYNGQKGCLFMESPRFGGIKWCFKPLRSKCSIRGWEKKILLKDKEKTEWTLKISQKTQGKDLKQRSATNNRKKKSIHMQSSNWRPQVYPVHEKRW